MTRGLDACAAAISGVPSLDPESTTTISLHQTRESRHWEMRAASFLQITQADTSNDMPKPSLKNRPLRKTPSPPKTQCPAPIYRGVLMPMARKMHQRLAPSYNITPPTTKHPPIGYQSQFRASNHAATPSANDAPRKIRPRTIRMVLPRGSSMLHPWFIRFHCSVVVAR